MFSVALWYLHYVKQREMKTAILPEFLYVTVWLQLYKEGETANKKEK